MRLALELGHFVLQKLGLHFEFAGSFFPLFELRLQIFLVRFQIRGLRVGLLFIGNLEVELDVVHVAPFWKHVDEFTFFFVVKFHP